MECALSLAGLALGYTSPNPAVGAVVVRDGMVVGLGHTQPPGCEHAEVMALRQAGERARGATMYVTLEPCCHQGRTPPCTQAIIDACIAEVHVALVDPNPLVSGKGLKILEEAGIKSFVGQCQEGAREINEGYIKFITTGMPFVIAKFAMSLDGKIATQNGDSKWISGEESRKFVHYLRHIVDAIMVGANTVVADDPQLSARGCRGKGGKTKLQLLSILGKREVTSVLVEGGSGLFGSLFDHCLVDKVLAFISPIIIGGDGAKSAVGGNGVNKVAEALRLNRVKVIDFGDDVLISGYVGDR